MNQILIRLDSEMGAKVAAHMKEKRWKGQAFGMAMLDAYFDDSARGPEQTITITPPKKQKAAVPIEDIVGLYHTYCPDLPQTRKAGATLIKQITARYNEDKEHQSADWWLQYFSDIAKSDFLCGRASDFRASLIWLTKPANMEKVLGGQYINHQAAGVTRAPQQHSQVTKQNISNMTSWLESKNAEE